MTRIFLVRHGEAEGNLYRRAQGQFDAPLTPRGRKQLTYLAERFRKLPLDAAYSSDLSRAYETALAAAAPQGLAVTKDVRLREMGLGVWENRPWGDIAWETPEEMRRFSLDPARWTTPGHEDFTALQNRMETALLDIAARHPGQTVLCASHGMAIRALLARLQGVASENIGQVPHADNTAVALLTAEGGALQIEYFNDASHLPPEESTFSGQSWFKSNTGTDSLNLRYQPFDMETGRERYLDCYRDAWQVAHGSLAGFDAEACWRGALCRVSAAPGSLLEARFGDGGFAGLIALDERRGARAGIGWISFCYIVPEERRRRCGIQLIGCAVARYRALGRRALRLSVAPENPARGFYETAGFSPVGMEPGALESLVIMELPL